MNHALKAGHTVGLAVLDQRINMSNIIVVTRLKAMLFGLIGPILGGYGLLLAAICGGLAHWNPALREVFLGLLN